MSRTGAAVLAWTAGDPNFTNIQVRVATRRYTSAAWGAPSTVSHAAAQLAAPEAVAINGSGQGVVIYSAFNGSFTMHTEYAVTN
jgi:hypothetical protein